MIERISSRQQTGRSKGWNPYSASVAVLFSIGILFSANSILINSVQAQTDVIVGDLSEVAQYGSVGDIYAYAIGTTSCNVGTEELLWEASTPFHPVIGQEIYKLKDGRFKQIGVGWLKHAFFALSQNLCDPCSPTAGQTLGVGCSDPYTASRNGTQSTLGPRSQVNAFNGVFPYPFTAPPAAPTIGRRVQVDVDDLNPVLNQGAQYFVEGHYVTQDDAQAGNGENNVSYRAVTVDSNPDLYALSFIPGQPTVREQPAIYAWQAADPTVTLVEFNVPGEGLFILGYKVTPLLAGTWHYDYALYNMNSHESAHSFSVPISPGTTISNAEFNGVPYHSGEPFESTPWVHSSSGGAASFATENFATNPLANALRWSRMYNFSFDSNSPPVAVQADIGLYRSGGSLSVSAVAPGIPPLAGPSDLICTVDLAGAHLDWLNGDSYSAVEIRKNGFLFQTLSGMATNFTDSTVLVGSTNSYEVSGVQGALNSPAEACTIIVPVMTPFRRGNLNGDSGTDISDAVFGLNALFVPLSPQSTCDDAADVNDDGSIDVSDMVFLLQSLFVLGSVPIPDPNLSCGTDPTADSLECLEFNSCP